MTRPPACLPVQPSPAWYLFECILKILKLDNCVRYASLFICCSSGARPRDIPHSPQTDCAHMWLLFVCGDKSQLETGSRFSVLSSQYLVLQPSLIQVAYTSSRTPCRLRRLVDKVKQFVEISWKLNEIVKSISHILLFLYSFSSSFSARQSFLVGFAGCSVGIRRRWAL